MAWSSGNREFKVMSPDIAFLTSSCLQSTGRHSCFYLLFVTSALILSHTQCTTAASLIRQNIWRVSQINLLWTSSTSQIFKSSRLVDVPASSDWLWVDVDNFSTLTKTGNSILISISDDDPISSTKNQYWFSADYGCRQISSTNKLVLQHRYTILMVLRSHT